MSCARGEDPALSLERRDHRARERGRTARLGDDRMRGAVEDQLVAAGADVQPQGDLVAHRPARQEDGRLLAEQRCDAALERGRRRVLRALLVAHLRARHRRAHRGGGLRLRVAVQVDRRHLRRG